jgi:hypothetical protein
VRGQGSHVGWSNDWQWLHIGVGISYRAE